jgi:hypothetical protein
MNSYHKLPFVSSICVPRLVKVKNKITNIQVHGLCDASQAAYGACIFLHSTNEQRETACHLLCTKSRVAPAKQQSIPRLELCGALLLARLVKQIVQILCLSLNSIHLWIDSMIVLAWLTLQRSGAFNSYVLSGM